jgi:hypothetical protein
MPNLAITEPCYWLATDRVKVAHFAHATPGTHIATGQPYLTTYATMAELVAVLMGFNFPVISGLSYPYQEWYLWATKQQADAALAQINSNPAFPVMIPDPATDERTVSVPCWCQATRLTADGRWGFRRIPSNVLDEWSISEESRAAWLAAFQPEIVTDPILVV